MAAAFNLTAQINLQGPSNVKNIVSDIKRQISGAKISLDLDVGTNAAKNISSITRRLNNLSKAAVQANSNVATLGSTLSSLSSSFNTASSAANNNAASVARTAQSVASAGKAIQQTRTNIEEFGKQAGLAVKRFAAFSTVTAPIYALTNAINNGFKEFLNFNKEIVRLSQVTGQSVGDLGAVSKEITRLSTGLGVASSDLLQVATTLAQAGLSAEDTKIALEALAKSALAPSFESLTDTTEGAIAAMRQFGIQSRELDGALGSINAVAAAFAVEAGDIITAIQRTGGVFSAASRGVSEGTDALNEFIAIFTSVRATTRESAETIATGLRTIFTRIQRVKTIEQLRQFGIELQDAEGKFIGLYEATRRLSEGLNKIDPRSAEFATISEELGGFRQIGKVIPFIQQFAVAEQALAVAQKGTKSTSKDALIAQQSLAVQFEKTRQNFLALIREIGESSSFKAFVGVSLTLADAFINLGRALKPLLPLLLTFASIKAGGAIKEFGSGFGGVFGFGGGGLGGGGTGTGGGTSGGGGTGGAGQSANITALTSNTTTLNTVAQALTSLNQSILALNQNVVYSNSLALNRPTRGFATGGLVPGVGNSDTVGAMLTPGEFVIRKKAVESIGAHNLAAMNSGGEVQRFEGGSPGGVRVPSGKGRGKKVRKGARGKFEHLNQSQLESLSTEEMIDYAKKQMYHIMTTGGSGMAIGKEFVEVPESRITPELAKDLIMGPNGKMGFEREIVAPFGSEKVAKSKKSEQQKRREKFFRSSRDLLTAAMQGIMAPGSALPKAQQDAIAPLLGMVASDYALGLSATPRLKSEEVPASSTILSSITEPLAQFRKSGGKTSLAGVIPKEVADKIRDAIPGYIESLQKENEKQKVGKARTALKYFDSFIGGGTTDVPGQATAFTETINQIIKNNLVRFASGGSVQKFKLGSKNRGVQGEPLTAEQILSALSTTGISYPIGETGGFATLTSKQLLAINPIKGSDKPSLSGKLQDYATKANTDINTMLSVWQQLRANREKTKTQAISTKASIKQQKQQTLASKQALRFGLVGLRYGTEAKNKFAGNIPPSFSGTERLKSVNGQSIEVISGSLSSSFSASYAKMMENTLLNNFESSVAQLAQELGSRIGANVDTNSSNVKQRVKNTEFYNVIGAGLEAAIGLLGAPYVKKEEDTKSIDFPSGLGQASKLFSIPNSIPTDVTRTIGPGGKGAPKYLEQISRFLDTPAGQEYATNRTTRRSKFAKGGLVQRFTNGGNVPKINSRIYDKMIELSYDDPEVKGYLHAEQDADNPEIYRVERVSAEPKGKGYGKRLYQEAIQIASSKGLLLAPSKRSTSDSAFNVWKSMFGSDMTESVPLGAKDWSTSGRSEKMISKYPKLRYSDPSTHPPADDTEWWALNSGYRVRKAIGGGISGQDTVPALLTPGEFVFNKKAAQRIGYGTLNKLNKADKVQGFNKGGAVGVQKFAGGGMIDAVGGPAAAVAAITSVLLPQIEQLASSMSNLNGQTSSLAAGFSAAIRESSSLVLSTAQVLRGVGASKGTVAATQAGVGIVGAVSGFITEKSAKDLDKALLKNSEAFGKFDKNLQDLTQAPTEELRIEAAARLEKSFMELDASVRNSVTSLNSLEIAKNIGESLGNVNVSILTSISAYSALSSATKDIVSSAQQAAQRAAAAAPFASMGGAMGQAASAASNIGIVTKLLGKFGSLIPFVGTFITVVSLATEGMKLFYSSTQKSAEQLDKLSQKLDETTKNSNANSLASENFVNNVLPAFRRLQTQTRDPEELKRTIGATTGASGQVNELNLLFTTALRSRFAEKSLVFKQSESVEDFRQAVIRITGNTKLFDQVVAETAKDFEQAQFIMAKMSGDQSITREMAEAEYKRLGETRGGREERSRIAQERAGNVDRQILSLQSLTDANNRVVISLLTLDNVLVSLSAKITQSIDKSINSFDDLDLVLSTLKGEPEQIGGRFFRREAAVLENLGAASSKDIERISGSVSRILGIPSSGEAMQRFLAPNKEGKISGDRTGLDSVQQFRQITAQVEALRLLKTNVPVILRDIQTQSKSGKGGLNQQNIEEELQSRIGKQLATVSGVKPSDLDPIIKDMAARLIGSISGKSESVKGLDDLARNNSALAEALKNGETSLKVFQSALEATAKFEDKMAEQRKKLIDLENSLIDAIVTRKQTELQSAVELKKIRGEDVSFGELKDIFDVGIKELTNVGGAIPQGGTTNVQTIVDQLKASQDAVAKFTNDIREAQIAGDNAKAKTALDAREKEVVAVFRLNKALNTLANSSELTQKALDKVAEVQNKFKSQRDIFFDFMRNARNPAAALEQRKVFNSIEAALSGNFRDIEQALLFQEKGAAVLKGLRPEINIEELLNRAAESISGKVRPLNVNDIRIKAAVGARFRDGAEGTPEGKKAMKELESAQQTADEARKALIEQLKAQTTTITDTTSQIFNEFNLDLAKILPEIIARLETLKVTRTNQQALPTERRITKENIRGILGATTDVMIPPGGQSNREKLGFSSSLEFLKELLAMSDKQRPVWDVPSPGLGFSPETKARSEKKLETMLDKDPEMALKEIYTVLMEESERQLKYYTFISADLIKARAEVVGMLKELGVEVPSRFVPVTPQSPLPRGRDDSIMFPLLDQNQQQLQYGPDRKPINSIPEQIRRTRAQFRQETSVTEGGITTSRNGVPVQLTPDQKKEVDAVRRVRDINNGVDTPPQNPNLPAPLQQRTNIRQDQPSLLDSGSIQKFENGATVFAKSLTEAPLQNLTDSLNSFNATSQQLAASLESFKNEFREGMKGKISYDGNVQVSFADTLAVNIPKDNNTSLIEMIATAMRPIISTEVSKGLERQS